MSRRKQTNPRAIKRDGKSLHNFFLVLFHFCFNCIVSREDDGDNSISNVKSKRKSDCKHLSPNTFHCRSEFASDYVQSDSRDSSQTTEDDQPNLSIKCDNCQENFLTSEQFNHHRLYQCSFLTGKHRLINHAMRFIFFI